MHQHLLIALLTSVLGLAPGLIDRPPLPVATQPAALVVTLHDQDQQGIAGVIVTMQEPGGGDTLTATTNAMGLAVFATSSAPEVRVQLAGALPDGTALVLPGAEQDGISVILGEPPTVLNLRVEPDGTVLPDPGPMIVPDNSGIVVATAELQDPPIMPIAPPVAGYESPIPALVPPTPLVLPTVGPPASAGSSPGQAARTGAGDASTGMMPATPRWIGIFYMLILVSAIIGLFLFQRRMRVQ